MIIIHNQIHLGRCNIGRKTNIIIMIKIKSAILSSFAPISLSIFIDLAITPSKISVIPQHIYNTQNNKVNGFVNRIKSEHTIRRHVTAFAKLLIRSPHNYLLLFISLC